jgi:hypothetical protein
VVATNIAETSITIPGVVYVIDTGYKKEKEYVHRSSGAIEQLRKRGVSKAAAWQRTGRAGREVSPPFSFLTTPSPPILPLFSNPLRLSPSRAPLHSHSFPFPPARLSTAFGKVGDIVEPTTDLQRDGECFRLFTKEAFDKLIDFDAPEIQRCNLSSAVLQLVAMNQDPFTFEYIDNPGREASMSLLISDEIS